jgi:ABC-type transport system substrate-binding protein
MQELTFIRPLRFLSPNAFAEGSTSDPHTANSCEPGWGTIDGTAAGVPNVTCVGIANISGTGPFSFASREQSVLTTEDLEEERIDDIVTFQANSKYWGGAPAIETLKVVRYESTEEIKQALVDQTLDIMWGDGVLASNDITDIDRMNNPNLNVFIGEEIQNVILILNTGTPPLDSIRIRKAIIHAIDKKYLVKKELGGFTEPADNVFPRDMPYCDVDLTPHWDYDLEKAILVSCEGDSASLSGSAAEANKKLALGLVFGLGLTSLLLLGFAVVYRNKYKLMGQEMKRLKAEYAVETAVPSETNNVTAKDDESVDAEFSKIVQA